MVFKAELGGLALRSESFQNFWERHAGTRPWPRAGREAGPG